MDHIFDPEFPLSSYTVGLLLGHGTFGVVQKYEIRDSEDDGTRPAEVAVKTISEGQRNKHTERELRAARECRQGGRNNSGLIS